jgi:hypothetical protein
MIFFYVGGVKVCGLEYIAMRNRWEASRAKCLGGIRRTPFFLCLVSKNAHAFFSCLKSDDFRHSEETRHFALLTYWFANFLIKDFAQRPGIRPLRQPLTVNPAPPSKTAIPSSGCISASRHPRKGRSAVVTLLHTPSIFRCENAKKYRNTPVFSRNTLVSGWWGWEPAGRLRR